MRAKSVLPQVLFFTALAFVITFTSACATAQESKPAVGVPLPEDLKITQPRQDVPKELARYSGKWFGIWDGNVLEHVLVVEEVDGAGAKVIYAYGIAPSWNIYQPGSFRARGQFVKGSLVVETRRATITYKMRDDGTLDATYEGRGTSAFSTAKLKKAEQ